jgi:hypothetical protein
MNLRSAASTTEERHKKWHPRVATARQVSLYASVTFLENVAQIEIAQI